MNNNLIARFEIFLIVLSIISFSYFLNPNEIISVSSASPIPGFCCINDKEGNMCQTVYDTEDCDSENLRFGVSCDYSSECIRGCCYDENSGIYDPNVFERNCNYDFVQRDPNCLTLEGARRGCCIIGDSRALFVNQKQCELFTPRSNNLNWNPNLNELECLQIQSQEKEGACVILGADGKKDCKRTNREDCISLSATESNFYEDYLCTSLELNTICNKTKNTACFSGKDEVYFIDSCGNKANIYDINRMNNNDYWELIIYKSDSCGANSDNGNANSESCGNCDRFLGGICSKESDTRIKAVYGDYVCKDTGCSYKGKSYKNGESWCEYESSVGNGEDVVGARHFRYVCNYGDIDIVPCSDYREEVCIQRHVESETDTSKSVSLGECVENDWASCLSLNNLNGDMTQCSESSSCMIKTVNAGNFTKNFCLPRVAPGLNTQSEEEIGIFQNICDRASTSCVIKEKCEYDCHGKLIKCKCVENCECLEQECTDSMNEICTSIGDCGLKFNTQGKYTTNFQVLGEKATLNISEEAISVLRSNINFVNGKYLSAVDSNYNYEASILLDSGTEVKENDPIPKDKSNNEESDFSNYIIPLGIAGVASVLGNKLPNNLLGEKFLESKDLTWFDKESMPNGGSWAWEGFMASAMGAGIGFFAGGYISDWFGYDSNTDAALATQIGTAIIGGAIANMLRGGVSTGNSITFILGTVALLSSLFLDGEEDCDSQYSFQYREVIFDCNPWTPPVGGSDCEKCNNNDLRPCSEYMCQSLGSSCKLINKGTNDEICINNNPGDRTAPDIKEVIQSDERLSYSINGNNIEITGRSVQCLDPYNNYLIGIKTGEPSQCKYDFERKEIFDDLSYEFGNGYVYNHIANVQIPNPALYPSWDGKLSIYVRCRDVQNNIAPVSDFYKINMCVNPARDFNQPLIQTVPINSSYIKRNASQQDFLVYTNEPAECKWNSFDTRFNLMENEMECHNLIDERSSLGWMCNSTMPTPSNENKIYIRCKDQPNLKGIKEEERNENEIGKELVLRKAQNSLSLEGITPKGEIETTDRLTIISLKVVTSGGAGEEKCTYSFNGYGNNTIEFKQKNENIHEQYFDGGLLPGNYKIYIECVDKATDSIRGEALFQIIYDTSATQINRVFEKEGTLKIYTSKDRECRYSTNKEEKCSFLYDKGITIGISKEHSVPVSKGELFFIKCANKFGEVPSGCTEIISYV